MPHAGTHHHVKHHGSEVALKGQELFIGKPLKRYAGQPGQPMVLGQDNDQWIAVGGLVGQVRRQQWGGKNAPHIQHARLQVA